MIYAVLLSVIFMFAIILDDCRKSGEPFDPVDVLIALSIGMTLPALSLLAFLETSDKIIRLSIAGMWASCFTLYHITDSSFVGLISMSIVTIICIGISERQGGYSS